jgi:hypothetical protein
VTRRRRRFLLLAVAFLYLIVLLAGCSTRPEYSGFLTEYPDFVTGPEGGADLVYVQEGVDFARYDRLLLDHVVFYLLDGAREQGVDPYELKELADLFHRSLFAELAGRYPFVEKEGPGVLRIRPAITELASSLPAVGVAENIRQRARGGPFYGVGGASLEVEFLDGETGERVAAALDRRPGRKYKDFEGRTKWGGAEEAFRFWARRLGGFLDRARENR